MSNLIEELKAVFFPDVNCEKLNLCPSIASVSVGKKINEARNPIFSKNRISLTLEKMLNNNILAIYAKTVPFTIG